MIFLSKLPKSYHEPTVMPPKNSLIYLVIQTIRNCVEEHQKEFLHRTEQLLKGHSKLVSNLYQKDTIARWIKQVLEAAGIEIKKYSAHSSRAASTSSCKAKGLNLAAIMKSAG